MDAEIAGMDRALKRLVREDLPLYLAACQALSKAVNTDEVQRIRDAARALKAAAYIAKNKDVEIDAAEIRFRAQRRLGEMMDASPKNRGAVGSEPKKVTGVKRTPVKDETPTLAEAGIDKNQAKEARKLAAIPEKKFEKHMKDYRNRVSQETERVTNVLVREGENHLKGKPSKPATPARREIILTAKGDLRVKSTDQYVQLVTSERVYSIKPNHALDLAKDLLEYAEKLLG